MNLTLNYAVCSLIAMHEVARAQEPATDVYLDKTRARWEQVSRQIWDYAETALQESKSSAYLEDLLSKEGFKVQRGVGLPTAFVASAGSGSPVWRSWRSTTRCQSSLKSRESCRSRRCRRARPVTVVGTICWALPPSRLRLRRTRFGSRRNCPGPS